MAHGGPGGDKNGPADLFAGLATELLAESFSSIRFDFRGWGESEGEQADSTLASQVEDLREVCRFVIAKEPPNLVLLGESLGATVAVTASIPEAQRLVLLWPAFRLDQTDLDVFLTDEMMERFEKNGFIEDSGVRLGKAFADEIRAYRPEPYLQAIKVPTYIIHGTADRSVPYEQSIEALRFITAKTRLDLVPKADHGFRNPENQRWVIDSVRQWLRDEYHRPSR